ncbi:MAG TPA: class I SAM-dependent methyltransferase [Nitrososphaerales archaeon]|nr:class I SAM-dependent methyltransferase [Nitrososphaerales archaeon]
MTSKEVTLTGRAREKIHTGSHPPFNESYRGTPPWDIGRPQSEWVKLVRSGEVRGRVLDAGCGTGESAIYFAQQGLDVWGIDSAPLAIEKAIRKAKACEVKVRFVLGDALHLGELGEKFDTITDTGLFHVFSDSDRALYSASLRSAMKRNGTFLMLCFSTKEPADWGGPRRVSEDEIHQTFTRRWKVNYVKETRIDTQFHEGGGHALLASITAA